MQDQDAQQRSCVCSDAQEAPGGGGVMHSWGCFSVSGKRSGSALTRIGAFVLSLAGGRGPGLAPLQAAHIFSASCSESH